MNNIKQSGRKGMTLIEVLVTIAIFAIVIQVSYSIFFAGNKSFEVSKNIGFAQQDVRLATDFINSELRYINQLDNKPLEGKYFSLKIKNNGDQTYSIEKKEHGEGYEEGNLLPSINGKWSEISISNFEMGKLVSTISQIEGKQEYSIDNLEVALENNRDLRSNIEISSADEKNKIIYYAFPSDKIITSGDNIEEPEEPEEPIIPQWVKGSNYAKGVIVSYNGKIYTLRDASGIGWATPGKDYGIWKEVSELWLEYNVYDVGDEVLYSGIKYRAKVVVWSGNIPSSSDWAWKKIS